MTQHIAPAAWKQEMPAFREKAAAFYAGQLDRNLYKGFSGLYGSYAQKDGKASMLRLRMTAGRVTGPKLAFVADALRRYPVPRLHFTTGQTIQLHDLAEQPLCDLMENALDAGIVTMGGGGDFPRNVMCSPLAGLEAGEYFNVLPWAEGAADYLMTFIRAEKMPRKLKVGFSSSPANLTHATYRDLGFAARPDGTFDVYSAGGLGNNPRVGVLVGQAVPPEKILYYIKAMWLTFRAYGNYENRGKARTRYMQEVCGGPEGYAKAFAAKLQEVYASGQQLDLLVVDSPVSKVGDGSAAAGPRVVAQKQPGLYAVAWHPIGGMPDKQVFCAVADAVAGMKAAELRLAPDQTAWVVNLTGAEAERILALTEGDTAHSLFETSVSCIGGATCQVGVRDSQTLLAECVRAVREANLPDGALPKMYFSGCPSSCGAHQTGEIGLRGGVKKVEGSTVPAFVLYAGGCQLQGCEAMGRELGAVEETRIPALLVQLGQTVAASGKTYAEWLAADPAALDAVVAAYL